MFRNLGAWWNSLQSDPLGTLIEIVMMIAALLLSLILHEIGHGYVALKCGDPTAKMMGRLTLDPRKHLDPIGAICMFFLGIGWAKPVPINPYNFKKRDRDMVLVADIIIGFVNSYLVHTQSGVFLGVGLVFMLYTVLMLVSNVEDAFNEIWQVKKPRSIFRTFTDYLAMFFLFPIIIVLTSGISIFMATVADSLPDFLLLGPVVRWLIDLSPYVLMSGMFIALYIFMPNTRVRLKSALVPGILAGIAMQGLQIFYIHSQMFLSSYNAIYGSFAALPLFMLWVQISWTICLFGAELCYTNQNLDYYDYDANTGEISHRYKLLMASLLMSKICKRFANGQRAYSAYELRGLTNVPIRIVNDLLYELIDAKLLIEISGDEKGETSRFMPAEDINNLTYGVLVDRMESKGQWKIDLDVSKLFEGEWTKAIELRSVYLRGARDIKLQDL